MGRRALWALGLIWLALLAAGPAVGMYWDRYGYPADAMLVGNLSVVSSAVMTIVWGGVLGHVGRWDLIWASVAAGAVLLTSLTELSLKLTYRGDPPGAVVELLWFLLVLAVLMSLGGLLGIGVRRLRRRPS